MDPLFKVFLAPALGPRSIVTRVLEAGRLAMLARDG